MLMARFSGVRAIERMINARRYKARLANAMALACQKLTESERQLLLWRYENDLSLRQIGELLEINSSKINLLLRQIQHKLRDYIICCLSDEEGMNGRAIAESLQDIVENPYHPVSLLDCIKQSGSKRKPPEADRCLSGRSGLKLVKS